MAAVDEHCQLNAFGPPKIVERIQRRADRAPAEKDIIHQHDGLAAYIKGDNCGLNVGGGASVEIIPVHAHVEASGWNRMAPDARKQRAQSLGQWNAAARD